MTSEQFNQKYATGIKVTYYPLEGSKSGAFETSTRSVAWNLGHGQAVVQVKGKPGCVSIDHLEIRENPGEHK